MSVSVQFTRNRHLDYQNNVFEQTNDSNANFLCALFRGKKFTVQEWGPTTQSSSTAPYQQKHHQLEAQEVTEKTWKKVVSFVIAWIKVIFTFGYALKAARAEYLKREWIPLTKDNVHLLALGDAIINKDQTEDKARVISYLSYEKDLNSARFDTYKITPQGITRNAGEYRYQDASNLRQLHSGWCNTADLFSPYNGSASLVTYRLSRTEEHNTTRERYPSVHATFN